jgi:hypothetical protein
MWLTLRIAVVGMSAMTLAACAPTPASSPPQSAPTQPPRTPLAPTVVAVHTDVVPTAQALATQVAPSVHAAATETVQSVARSVSASPLQITGVAVDSRDTTVAIHNGAADVKSLLNYTLLMGSGYEIALGDIPIRPGGSVTLHLSDGTTTPTDAYLGGGSALAADALDAGEHVVLLAPENEVASIYGIQ